MTEANTKQVVFDPDSQRIEMIFNFPVYPERKDIRLRSAGEVARRALALHMLLGVIFYEEPEKVVNWAIDEGMWDYLSPREQKIFRMPLSDLSPAEKKWEQRALQSNLLTWRIEGLQALLWSIGRVDELDMPIERCDGSDMSEALPALGESVRPFIASARLRPSEEMVHTLEEHFQLYNQQVEAYEKGEKHPFDTMITYERIHALNWVCGLIDEWDD